MESGRQEKALILLSGEIRTPPLGHAARREIGYLIRQLQHGLALEMPYSRPMPEIGRRCHELRVRDRGRSWRVVYRTDPDAILVVAVFDKKTGKTPRRVVAHCKRTLQRYDEA